MADELELTPETGPGSQTPQEIPALHTPVGQGADTTGVQNVGKPQGLPGAPKKPNKPIPDPNKGNSPAVEQITPTEKLFRRSLETLRSDLIDFLIYTEGAFSGPKSIKNHAVKDINMWLEDAKQWHVLRLNELLPSREEKDILNFYEGLLNSPRGETHLQVETHAGTQTLSTKRSTQMDKILIDNGAIVTAKDFSAQLDDLALKIQDVTAARKALADTYVKQAGMDLLKDLDVLDSATPVDSLESLIGDLKSAIENLTKHLQSLDNEKGLSADQSLKFDGLKEKALKEKGKSNQLLENISKKEEGKEAEEEVEEEESREEEKEEKSASMTSPTKGGQPVKIQVAEAPKSESTKDAESAMEATMEAKESQDASEVKTSSSDVVSKIKERLAQLKSQTKEAQLYPFKDLNKQNQEGINAEIAEAQKKEIDKDLESGEMIKDKVDKFLGQNRDPKVNESVKSAETDNKEDVKTADSNASIPVKQAIRLKKNAVEEAIAKAKLSVELASIQQLKGLIENPLKDTLVRHIVEAGADEELANAIVHNAFIESYEASQRKVMDEAFNTFMAKSIDEFTKVAEFTQKFSAELVPTVQDKGELDTKEARYASESAPLRGSQVSVNSENVYRDFWKQAYLSRGNKAII